MLTPLGDMVFEALENAEHNGFPMWDSEVVEDIVNDLRDYDSYLAQIKVENLRMAVLEVLMYHDTIS